MKIETAQSWSPGFFEKFISIRNNLYSGHPAFLKESIESFCDLLSEQSPFCSRNQWKAWVLIEQGKVVGRVFASQRKDGFFNNKYIPFGYFEAETSSVANHLIGLVSQWAQDLGYQNIRGPIQGNAFNSSRFLIWSKRLFFGEPVHRTDYHEYFKSAGFVQSQHWVSVRYSRLTMAFVNFYFLINFFKGKTSSQATPIKVRQVDLNNWTHELKVMYELMMKSFAKMEHVEKISFEEFELFNRDLKHIIRSKDCLILEGSEGPLAFLILLKDQLSWLVKRQNWQAQNKYLGHLALLILGARLKLGWGKSLLLYLGKVPDEGKYKKLSHILYKEMLRRQGMSSVLNPPIFGFIADDSPTIKMIPPGFQVISEYCIYEKSFGS